MGRDSWRFHELDKEREKRGRMDPIWRGVGCVLIVLLGFVGYAFAGWFLGKNLVYIPPVVRRPPFAPWLPQDVFVKLVVAFLFMLLSFTILSAIYAMAFPIRPGETDAPPMKRRDKERW
ncbi:MAG TPA: hypothetical protein G4O11_03370 [Anaerolineae bacterium]|nr:hypothetical protein [Anaerolineae bacterium]